MPICVRCGKLLSVEERHYYEMRCEGCEREWFIEIEAWRAGGENEKLDALFGRPSLDHMRPAGETLH